jgi:hypothetical protein
MSGISAATPSRGGPMRGTCSRSPTPAAIATNTAFAGLMCPGQRPIAPRRGAAVRAARCRHRDILSGAVFHPRRRGDDPDVGRGHRPLVRRSRRPARPRPRHGARHHRTPRPGRAALLSLPLRRSHRGDEPPAVHRGARRHAAGCNRVADLVHRAGRLHRRSRAHQRGLRIHGRRRSDLGDRAALAREHARPRQSRPAVRKQVRADPAGLRSGRPHGRRRTPASRRARRSHPHQDRAGGGDRLDRRHHRAASCRQRPRPAVAGPRGAQCRKDAAARYPGGVPPQCRA